MPAMNMNDGNDQKLFMKFSKVAQKIGVYTAQDYAEIIGELVLNWKIETIRGVSGAAAKAQDYLCTLSERYQRLASRIILEGNEQFSWIYGREVFL